MSDKVLVIDDDPSMTDLFELLLKTHGFEVMCCNDSMQGVEKVKSYKPDVIILDLMMPGMDGWQACSAIRKFSNTPILILSALDKPGVVVSALDAGADDFLTKPVSTGLLVSRLKTLTRRVTARKSGSLIPVSTTPYR